MNPNFKPEMITPKLLKACGDQVQKYFGEREMDSDCSFCELFRDYDLATVLCSNCPLGDGKDYPADHYHSGKKFPCMKAKTYIHGDERDYADIEKRLARGKRLIEILDEHGITIYDKEVK